MLRLMYSLRDVATHIDQRLQAVDWWFACQARLLLTRTRLEAAWRASQLPQVRDRSYSTSFQIHPDSQG